jgi:hypothetical protein
VTSGALSRKVCPTCKADTSDGLQRNRAVEAINARVTRNCVHCDFSARADAFAAHTPCKRFYDRKVSCVTGNGRKITYRGLAGEESIAQIFDPERGTTQYLEGPAGDERVVKCSFKNGQVTHYAGARGEERRVRSVLWNGEVHKYEGAAGAERKTQAVMPDGTVQNYVGERRKESLVERVERSTPSPGTNGSTAYERVTTTAFGGAKGAEFMRSNTVDFPDAPWSERVVKRYVYEGTERGAERLRQYYFTQFAEDGTERNVSITWYEGPCGEERKTKSVHPGGTRREFFGPRGEERLVREVHANGTTHTFGGARGSERILSTVQGPTHGAAVSLRRVLGIGRGTDDALAEECAR